VDALQFGNRHLIGELKAVEPVRPGGHSPKLRRPGDMAEILCRPPCTRLKRLTIMTRLWWGRAHAVENPAVG
jgi:hypothetical protein